MISILLVLYPSSQWMGWVADTGAVALASISLSLRPALDYPPP